MSWNFSMVGQSKEPLKAAIQSEPYCPMEFKTALCAMVEAMVVEEGYRIAVQSDGHVDATYGGQGKFSISKVKLIE